MTRVISEGTDFLISKTRVRSRAKNNRVAIPILSGRNILRQSGRTPREGSKDGEAHNFAQ
jgi:hypothetical protein